jgi:hypothetical protein
MQEKSLACSMCGTAEWQWEADSDAYAAMLQVCPGCQRKDWAREEQEGKLPAGSSFVLVPRARVEALRHNPIKRPIRRRRSQK